MGALQRELWSGDEEERAHDEDGGLRWLALSSAAGGGREVHDA